VSGDWPRRREAVLKAIDADLTFLLLMAAVLVWLELLAQWPSDLMIYQGPPPPGTPWRLVGFAYAVQLTMVGFLGDFFWHVPRLAVSVLAAARVSERGNFSYLRASKDRAASRC
jgi:hypothetical protein